MPLGYPPIHAPPTVLPTFGDPPRLSTVQPQFFGGPPSHPDKGSGRPVKGGPQGPPPADVAPPTPLWVILLENIH